MDCIKKNTIWVESLNKLIDVPCGKCIPCLQAKRNDWSFRLEQENKVSKSAHFVTLTYDRKHLRSDEKLSKRDLQLYLKRLRKKDESNRIRYYAVGEYGSKLGRPHYHILLFNSTESDIRASWTDSQNRPIGIVHVGKVNPASIAYVTKYCIQTIPKARQKKGALYDGRPFATMSRAYGIGGNYLTDEMVAWHRGGDFNYTMRPDAIKGRLPRFYREKIWYKPKDRERISAAGMALTLQNQKLERDYYKRQHPKNWEAVMENSRAAVLSRVKSKIQFTQTF